MPTEYTDILDKNKDELDWLKRTLVRNFGVAFSLRESNMNMTFEELDAAIREPDDISYYEGRLKEETERLKALGVVRTAEWMHETEICSRKKQEKKYEKETSELRELHERTKGFLQAIKWDGVSQFTKDVVDFGIRQLEVVKSDTEPFHYPPMLNFEPWVKEEKNRCDENIRRNKEYIQETRDGDRERVALWDTFCKDIKKLEKKYRKP